MVGVLRIFPPCLGAGGLSGICLVARRALLFVYFSLEGNRDVGLEVREREYTVLRRSCDLVRPPHREWSKGICSLTDSGREESLLQAFVLDWLCRRRLWWSTTDGETYRYS